MAGLYSRDQIKCGCQAPVVLTRVRADGRVFVCSTLAWWDFFRFTAIRFAISWTACILLGWRR